MNNFTFQNPVKLIFGKGSIAKLAKEIPADKKIMVTFGGGSVKKNGRTATVTRSLELNKQLYTPAEYKDLRQLLTEWSDVNGKTLLFSVR